MANRSIDRIRNKKAKDDPVTYWPYGDSSAENAAIIVEITGDYPDDAHSEVQAECEIYSE